MAYADALVGQLDDALERLGLKSQTLLAVASDHGEGLGDHQETLHGFFVYQTTLAVPLILRGPGIVGGGRIAANVGLVDLLPTALDLLGVALPRGVSALGHQSRRGAPRRDRRRPPDSPQYAESLVPLLHFGWSDLRVLRRGSWKYVLAPKPELYDLASDSARATQPRGRPAGASRRRFEGRSRSSSTRNAASERRPRPDAARRAARTARRPWLRQRHPSTTATSGADPKDKILEFRRANEGMRERDPGVESARLRRRRRARSRT